MCGCDAGVNRLSGRNILQPATLEYVLHKPMARSVHSGVTVTAGWTPGGANRSESCSFSLLPLSISFYRLDFGDVRVYRTTITLTVA